MSTIPKLEGPGIEYTGPIIHQRTPSELRWLKAWGKADDEGRLELRIGGPEAFARLTGRELHAVYTQNLRRILELDKTKPRRSARTGQEQLVQLSKPQLEKLPTATPSVPNTPAQ